MNRDIYVKLLGEANTLRLTSSRDAYLAWSPDGKCIAFVRGVQSLAPMASHGRAQALLVGSLDLLAAAGAAMGGT